MSEAAALASAELCRRVTWHQVRKAGVDGFVDAHPVIIGQKERKGLHRATFLPGIRRYMEERCSGPLTVSMKAHHQARRAVVQVEADPGLSLDQSSAVDQPDGEELPSIVLSKQRQEHWKAVKMELDQRERMKQLLRREDMDAALLKLHRRVVDSVIRIPIQARVRLAHLRPEDVNVIKELAWSSLREISDGLEVE